MKKIVLGLLMAGVAATPAFAENADENPTIIVTGQRASSDAERRAAATPGGAAVITHQDYADKSLVSLRDTLAYTPGVYVQPRYGQEVRISIRGSGLSRGYHMRGLTLLQDGVPINLADDNGDFQELDPAFFDHLEVYRGANALRFGSGTLGGAINGVTPNGADAAGLYLRAEGGSFGTARGLIAYGGATDTADYWAAVSADTSSAAAGTTLVVGAAAAALCAAIDEPMVRRLATAASNASGCVVTNDMKAPRRKSFPVPRSLHCGSRTPLSADPTLCDLTPDTQP